MNRRRVMSCRRVTNRTRRGPRARVTTRSGGAFPTLTSGSSRQRPAGTEVIVDANGKETT